MIGARFKYGDKIKIDNGMGYDLPKGLDRFIGEVGIIVHAERCFSPYSGKEGQIVHARFPSNMRHISENSEWFILADFDS